MQREYDGRIVSKGRRGRSKEQGANFFLQPVCPRYSRRGYCVQEKCCPGVSKYGWGGAAKDIHVWLVTTVLGAGKHYGTKLRTGVYGKVLTTSFTEDMKSYLADTKVKPSAIKTINGKDAPTFLENESMHSFQTGKDAGYNAMLRSAVMNYNAAKTASLGNFGGYACVFCI